MADYTTQEEKELNAELRKWQNRAKRLTASVYYDSVANDLSDDDTSILTRVTNAESYKDINPYLWNCGEIERVLDKISRKLKEERKGNR